MRAEMQVRILIEGSWRVISIVEARELRDFLMAEPSVTVPTTPADTVQGSAKKR